MANQEETVEIFDDLIDEEETPEIGTSQPLKRKSPQDIVNIRRAVEERQEKRRMRELYGDDLAEEAY